MVGTFSSEDGLLGTARSRGSALSSQRATSSARDSLSTEPHPCMIPTLTITQGEAAAVPAPNVKSEEWQEVMWLLHQQFAAQKEAFEAMLLDQQKYAARQTAKSLERIEGLIREHQSDFGAQFEASALKLQRQEQRIEEHLDRLMQQRSSMDALSARTPRLSVDVVAPPEGSEQFYDVLVKRFEASSEERIKEMQEQSLTEIQKLFQSHPLFRSQERKAGNGEPTYVSEMGASRPLEKAALGHSPKGDISALSAVQGISDPNIGKRNESAKMTSMSLGSLVFRWSSTSSTNCVHVKSANALLDMVAAFLILANCVWMGVEAEMTMYNRKHNIEKPEYVGIVEITFAVIFTVELAFRFFIQGKYFYRCPNLRFNLFDMLIILLTVVDVLFSFYNVSWMRSFRVLRLFNAARIIRSMDYVKQLRLLVSAITGSMEALFWVLVLLCFVLYLCSVFVIQAIQGHVESAATLDPALMQYYGSVSKCMLTLFKSITGGAPWEVLAKPLTDISEAFLIGFILFFTFVIFGLLNIVTAIFVESAKSLAQRDSDMRVKDIMSRKDSSINQIRKIFQEADTDGTGWITGEELEDHLQDRHFTRQLRHMGMEVWEARGLFQLLDTDALGQVSIEELLHGMVRLKCKDQAVDLATVMYENKRILTRLLAFMRFSEDHFKDLQSFLGMHARSAQRVKNLEHYLQEANHTSRAMGAANMTAIRSGRQV